MKIIRYGLVFNAVFFAISSSVYNHNGDMEKWFSRVALSLILFALWGIMMNLKEIAEKLREY